MKIQIRSGLLGIFDAKYALWNLKMPHRLKLNEGHWAETLDDKRFFFGKNELNEEDEAEAWRKIRNQLLWSSLLRIIYV